MTEVHRYLAYLVPAGFALLLVWSIAAFVRNKAPGGGYWNLLAALQVTIGLQVLVGGLLYAIGGRPATNGPEWLHYVYGGLFPAVVLVFAHRFARKMEGVAWIVFGFAGLVCFGLTFRALQTGLGID
ncbi:MAG: hypothetical protein ABR575_10375 [Actinomycetota bacterium]